GGSKRAGTPPPPRASRAPSCFLRRLRSLETLQVRGNRKAHLTAQVRVLGHEVAGFDRIVVADPQGRVLAGVVEDAGADGGPAADVSEIRPFPTPSVVPTNGVTQHTARRLEQLRPPARDRLAWHLRGIELARHPGPELLGRNDD